jgi:hypothetical protein
VDKRWLLGWKLRFNLAALIDKYNDIQKSQFDVPPVTLVPGRAAAKLKSVEAELTASHRWADAHGRRRLASSSY